MRAWRVHQLGEPRDVLRLEEVPDPVAGPGEAVIDVEAVACNFPDILLCRGQYQEKPLLPFTPGLEVSGRVRAVGPDTSEDLLGRRVIAVTSAPKGGMAEMVAVPASGMWPADDGMSPPEAAALPVAYQTGWFGLHHRAHLQHGETLLVHAAAGGVGSAAVQLGKAAGARVIATAGGPDKVEVCRKLGADVVVDYRHENFVEVVREVTGGRGADVIYDPVGGDIFDQSRRCLAWEGRLLVIGFTSGRIPDVPANHVLLKNYSVVGLHWGQYLRRDPELVAHAHAELLDLWRAGKLAPLVSAEYPMEEAPAALERLASRATWGKVVLRP